MCFLWFHKWVSWRSQWVPEIRAMTEFRDGCIDVNASGGIMRTREEVRLLVMNYTGRIERLRRKIDEGRYFHAILRYKERDVSQLRRERSLLLWVLEN